MTLAPSAPSSETDEKLDDSNLVLLMLLEQHAAVWGRVDMRLKVRQGPVAASAGIVLIFN